MLKLSLIRALQLRGVGNHKRFLRDLGFAASSVKGFLNGTAEQIKYEQLEQLCVALNCTPNDLFEWQPDERRQIAPTHSLNKLKKKNLAQMLNDVPLEKFEQVETLFDDLQKQPAL